MIENVTRPVVRSVTRAVSLTRAALPGSGLSAFSATKYAIQQDAADVNLLVVGDSTGDAADEWVYLFGQWLATQYPTHSVSYRLWDDTNNVYGVAAGIATGSGSNTIRIWNASIAGKGSLYLTGAKQSALSVNADLVLFSHGKNGQNGLTTQQINAENMMGWEAARLANPSAYFAPVLQCPNRDDSGMDVEVAQQRVVAALYPDVRPLDVYSAFIARNKDPSLYKDNVHPGPDGSALWVGVIEDMWRRSPATTRTNGGALLATTDTNLLSNGDFADFTGALPAGWTGTSSPTAVKELTTVDGASAYSLKLTGTAAGARIQNFIGTSQRNSVKGKLISLAVRGFVPAGSADSVGRVGIIVDSTGAGSVVTTSASFIEGKGGWRWVIVQGVPVPLDATNVRVFLYCDSSANATSAAYYDRAVLVQGDIPRDMA